MKLAQGEYIIGEWKYADEKTKNGFSNDIKEVVLTLTNKRIIHDCTDKHSISRDEIQLKQITSLNYHHNKKSNVGVWIRIILGVLLCPVIIGIFILKKAISQLNSGDFSLVIKTFGVENIALSIGASKGKQSKKKEVVTSIHVHHDVIDEIIDVLGAAVMDSKSSSHSLSEYGIT